MNYYEAALKNSTEAQPHLRIELAELYLKLKQFDKADRTVRAGLSESREAGEDLVHLMDVTRYWQLLATVYQRGGREVAKITTALESARDNQARCAGTASAVSVHHHLPTCTGNITVLLLYPTGGYMYNRCMLLLYPTGGYMLLLYPTGGYMYNRNMLLLYPTGDYMYKRHMLSLYPTGGYMYNRRMLLLYPTGDYMYKRHMLSLYPTGGYMYNRGMLLLYPTGGYMYNRHMLSLYPTGC